MEKSWHLKRRTFLKGLGVTCALPFLESMGKDVVKNPNPAKRCVFSYIPNGVSMPDSKNPAYKDWHWFPHGEGKSFTFTKVNESLKSFKKNLLFVGGLSHPKSRNLLGHAAGDTWLTGGDIGGSTYKNSISIDQAAANVIGKQTRFKSLLLSCDGGVGYKSRVSTCSFDINGKAIPTECNPREIFERYFSSNDAKSKEARRKSLRQGKKIVDLIREDAKGLSRKLGKQDNTKLDEYLGSVSQIEGNIKRTEQWLDIPMKKVNIDHINFSVKQTAPKDYIRTMYDLIALAFEADITRCATYMIAREDGMGYGDKFPVITFGYKGHHSISHDKSKGGYERWGHYDQFLNEQYAYFIDKLSKLRDENGSILDSTMAMHGSACSTTHNARNYPIVIAGGQGLGLAGGTFLKYDEKTPLSNMYATMLNILGVPTKKFADSTKDFELTDMFA
ncbi:MAG: DUF1552 domain-containing protein [Lentisphaerales bacterium]|nr:DUF1552 domain-containing protein [Lentisphaerales bacterium]